TVPAVQRQVGPDALPVGADVVVDGPDHRRIALPAHRGAFRFRPGRVTQESTLYGPSAWVVGPTERDIGAMTLDGGRPPGRLRRTLDTRIDLPGIFAKGIEDCRRTTEVLRLGSMRARLSLSRRFARTRSATAIRYQLGHGAGCRIVSRPQRGSDLRRRGG